ncbi:hypothetical protein Mapa_007472 [Marchantia paleacea]|nr:hypothetical protein Mapa_007472 [Marchantia paleacea]
MKSVCKVRFYLLHMVVAVGVSTVSTRTISRIHKCLYDSLYIQSASIATHDAIKDVVFGMARECGYLTWRERWYALQSTRVRADLYLVREDQVTMIDVVVTDPTRDTVSEGMITNPLG